MAAREANTSRPYAAFAAMGISMAVALWGIAWALRKTPDRERRGEVQPTPVRRSSGRAWLGVFPQMEKPLSGLLHARRSRAIHLQVSGLDVWYHMWRHMSTRPPCFAGTWYPPAAGWGWRGNGTVAPAPRRGVPGARRLRLDTDGRQDAPLDTGSASGYTFVSQLDEAPIARP